MTNQPQEVSLPTEAAANTDRELWREGDYYTPSIHVTAQGGIGINVGGRVFVKPLREWHNLAMEAKRQAGEPTEAVLRAQAGEQS